MSLPISTSSTAGLVLAAVFGTLFGVLLNKGRVTQYDVIVNLFRFRDLTVLKVMLTAIVVGGIGVFAMMHLGWLEGWHIKDANVLALILGGALFGVGMVLYGYCPGTGVAAIATGSLHALVGFFGMIAGGIVYAFTYPWLQQHVLGVGALGKVRLADVTHIPDIAWWAVLAVGVALLFRWLEKIGRHATVS
ncbi:MAG: YeeE/YedE family protein [Verrucomicrobiae bacterium]|nr:YeeE/YedE family protein [Verrucomicrobiae bacterium]